MAADIVSMRPTGFRGGSLLERLGLAVAAGGGMARGEHRAARARFGPTTASRSRSPVVRRRRPGRNTAPAARHSHLPLPATPCGGANGSDRRAAAVDRQNGLGGTRWNTRNGKRVQYRDWMTDPADVMTLLGWTSAQLGINYRAIEAEFDDFSFDPRELPALPFAGHDKFELPAEVRPKLAGYVTDGGTIIGDACCGWTDFAESFRREMELIFPIARCGRCCPDDPLFSSYYKLGEFTYKKADGST